MLDMATAKTSIVASAPMSMAFTVILAERPRSTTALTPRFFSLSFRSSMPERLLDRVKCERKIIARSTASQSSTIAPS